MHDKEKHKMSPLVPQLITWKIGIYNLDKLNKMGLNRTTRGGDQ